MLEFCNQLVPLNPDWSNINKVQVQPSPITGTLIYKIDTSDDHNKQSIEVSYNPATQQKIVINLVVVPVAAARHPKPAPLEDVAVEDNPAEVQQYLDTLLNSNIPHLQNANQIASIQKEHSPHYVKTYLTVLNPANQPIKVTLLTQPG